MKIAKIYRFFGPIIPVFSGIGGYPLPPLTENHPAHKPLAEMGGTPPTLTEKICEVVFDRFPKHEPYFELHGKPFNVVLSYLLTR